MNPEMSQLFWISGIFALLLFITAFYCILISKNLIRILIGVELLTKAVTLLLIVAGDVTGAVGVTQAMVITLILVEVVVIAVAAGIIIGTFRRTESLSVEGLTDLKG